MDLLSGNGLSTTAGVAVQLATVEVSGFRVVDAAYNSAQSLPRHTHPRAALSFVSRGSFRETSRRGVTVCSVGAMHVRPSEEPHANEFDDGGARLLIVDLPLDPGLGDRRIRRLVGRSAVVSDGTVRTLAGQLEWELHHRDQATHLAVHGLVLALLAQLVRSTGVGTTRDDAHPPSVGTRVERARDFIDAHFARPLRLAEVAAVADLHPSSLARAFKRRYHVTPWQYQRQRQLEWVKAELLRSERSIATIAHEAGFADHSHLTRAFQAAEGVPPSAVRRRR